MEEKNGVVDYDENDNQLTTIPKVTDTLDTFEQFAAEHNLQLHIVYDKKSQEPKKPWKAWLTDDSCGHTLIQKYRLDAAAYDKSPLLAAFRICYFFDLWLQSNGL
jgi:hypothetical protein